MFMICLLTFVDRAHRATSLVLCDLPPSSQLTHEKVTLVLNHILGCNFRELGQLCAYLTKQLSTFNSIHPQPQNVDVQDFQEEFAGTKFLGNKEASGRVILGRFMTKVRIVVAAAYPKAEIIVDHEYRVLKENTYACDEAVSAALALQRGPYQEKLLLGMEYKPKVSSDLMDQPPFHLSEVFIQAYYVKKSMTHDVWHCLTDMKDFHYFLVGATPEKEQVSVKKYYYLQSNLSDQTSVANHLYFLAKNLSLPE